MDIWILSTTLLCMLSVYLAASEDGDAKKTELKLARSGRSDYKIVISASASEMEKKAAAELQHFIKKVSETELPITTDDQPLAEREIILGRNLHLGQIDEDIDFGKLGGEGFTIRTSGNHLIIAGGPVRGTLYGVCTFLEDYLGCRWLSPNVSVIPKMSTITTGHIDDTQVPKLQYREVYYYEAMDPDFALRHKLNGNSSDTVNGSITSGSERHTGWGLWCHTFNLHVPPEKYFEDHPEYFSMIDGKRTKGWQLCLTNPDVLRLTIEDLKKRMTEEPEAHYWSVSQNDCYGECQCPQCKAIDDREGTPMGSMLEFVNKVAAEFPDKTISTLSYQYTRKPPKTIKPADNVLIMLCSIECNRSRPIATDPTSREFRDDVVNWSKICDNVFIWDYVVQFANLVSPFPNLRTLQPNMRFFVEHNAKGMFPQGNRETGGEFAELRTYILSKLIWNPDCDVEKVMEDFLAGYYGKAAVPIREYIDMIHDELEKFGRDLVIGGSPTHHTDNYLREDLLVKYNKLFDEAEKLVADDPDVLKRVKSARLPLMYAQLEIGYGDVAARRKIADEFFALAEATNLQMLNEWTLTKKLYKERIDSMLAEESAPQPEG